MTSDLTSLINGGNKKRVTKKIGTLFLMNNPTAYFVQDRYVSKDVSSRKLTQLFDVTAEQNIGNRVN